MSEEDIRATRLEKAEQFRQLGINPYAYRWESTHHTAQLQQQFVDLPSSEEADLEVAVAGRVMGRRFMGKLAFCTLEDDSGKIQLYIEKQVIDEAMEGILPNAFKTLDKLVDVGDIIGVKGTIKRTQKGELSVYVKQFNILSKSLLPLPDKWHGLTDIAKRYRQRYVDLIVNPEVRSTFRRRAQITAGIRRYLEERDFLEIETPVLQSEAGGADARPFITYHNTLEMELYLRIATELHLKRLIVGGLKKFLKWGGFSATRVFRLVIILNLHRLKFIRHILIITT